MPDHNRLFKALTSLDPAEMDRVFGREAEKLMPAPTATLANVKRVALFTESFFPKIDGVSKSAYLTLRYLQKTGREVLVFAPDIAPDAVGDSRVVPNPSVGMPFAPETRLAFPSLQVNTLLREFKPDVIHLFSPVLLSAAGMAFGQRQNIPVVANFQTDLPAYARYYGFWYMTPVLLNWLRYLHNSCDLTLVPSEATREQLEAEDFKRMRIWRRGVDLQRFHPNHRSAEMRARLLNGRDPNALVALYVGRLATEKRIDLLLEVAKLPGVALTIVGDGHERETLEALFAHTDTHFTGYMVGEDLATAYASADAFLFPGPTETFGQVVQEAMASGLPCLVINQGGVKDLVQDGINGFVCTEDVDAFAQGIRILRSDPDLRRRMALRSRELAYAYPWSVIMGQLETYYDEAVMLHKQLHQPSWFSRPRLPFNLMQQ